ncbi:hypothetical protein GJAV_G00221230 [Gymnothorax javanicus]|nr:hypothetical protein GJAV_G00221230 [Gymnothorax javanicus]
MLGTLCALISVLLCVSGQKVLTQTPSVQSVNEQQNATMDCNIARPEKYYVLWFKQTSQKNGQTERMVQEIFCFLRAFCRNQQSWSQFLHWAEHTQNSNATHYRPNPASVLTRPPATAVPLNPCRK